MRIPSPPPLLAYLTTGAYARLPPGDSGPHANRRALSCDRSCRTPFGASGLQSRSTQPSADRVAQSDVGSVIPLRPAHGPRAFVREGPASARAALTLPGVSRWLPHCVGSSIPPGAIHKSSTELKPLAGQIHPCEKCVICDSVLSPCCPGNCRTTCSNVRSDLRRDRPRRPIRGDSRGCANRMDTRVAAGRASPGRMPR